MEEFYRDQGFHAARVAYEFEEGPPLRAVFSVFEGPRAYLGKVSLPGRGSVDRSDLTRFFEGPRATFGLGGTLYSRSRVEQAARSIEAFYQSEGYLRAEVEEPEVTFRADGTLADVTLLIRPGHLYRIRSVRFEGFDAFPREELDRRIPLAPGRAFTRLLPFQAERNLMGFLRSKGYFRPEVEADANLLHGSGWVDVTLRGAPGERRRVGEIRVEGLERTQPAFLPTLISLESGEWLDGGAISESVQKLYGTGLFQRVSVDEVPVGEEEVDLHFRFHERDARNLDLLFGYGSYELLRSSVRYTDRNVAGRALNWSSSAALSFRLCADADQFLTIADRKSVV